MRIDNIDAPAALADKVARMGIPGFVQGVVEPLERAFVSLARHFYEEYKPQFFERHRPWRYDWLDAFTYSRSVSHPLSRGDYYNLVSDIRQYCTVFALLHLIPIHLREFGPDARGRDDLEEGSIIDQLGAYFSCGKGNSPYIELYLSEIDKATNGNDSHFRWLFTKVLIHELAHASMDVENPKVSYRTVFGKWREESMANAVALRIIKDHGGPDFYDYAKQFMLSQPIEYALGVLMESFDCSDFKDVVNSKRWGVNEDLQDVWLGYAGDKPDWNGLHKWNGLLARHLVLYFNGQYYVSRTDTTYAIVDLELSSFEFRRGRKMSVKEFMEVFPRFVIDSDCWSYQFTEQVNGDSKYEKTVVLQDGSVALYYSFSDEKVFHKFIAKTNRTVREFRK